MLNRLRTALLPLLFAASPALAADVPARPNILILFADDLGWTDLSTGLTNFGNGNTYAQTPAIDHLATQSLCFSNMHTCPNCAPARAALMTGQYAVRNGVYNVGSLDRGKGLLTPAHQRSQHILHEAVTFAETLKTAGYVTCHVGKYHVSSEEDVTKYDGFDFDYGGGHKGDGGPKGYFAIKDPSSPTGYSFGNLGPEMGAFAAPYTQDYVDKNLKPYANGNDPAKIVGTPKHLTDADADAAIDFLDKHLASADKDKPFFMNVAFNAVHVAIRPRHDLRDKYVAIQSHDDRHARADYAALTEGEDQACARILRYLDEHDLAKSTLVIYTSDNGGSAAGTHNDPLRGYKGEFYEGGLRVPAIFRLPGRITPGTTDAIANLLDLYPTFADFAGAKLPDPAVHPLDGLSLLPLLTGQTKSSPRTVTYYHFPGYLDTRAFPSSTIIKLVSNKNYKLIYSYEDQHYELYNLTDDFVEHTDLLKDAHPAADAEKVATDLRDDLVNFLTTTHPLMATDPATNQPTPLPIPVSDALKSGNHIKRVPTTQSGESGND